MHLERPRRQRPARSFRWEQRETTISAAHLSYVRMSERPLRGAAADSKEDSSSSGTGRRDVTGDDAEESAAADAVGGARHGQAPGWRLASSRRRTWRRLRQRKAR